MADNHNPPADNDEPQYGPALPLPDDLVIDHSDDAPPDQQAAAELVRHKVDAAFEQGSQQPAPDFAEEALEAAETKAEEPAQALSKHQQFIYDLSASGKPLRDINSAWHEYYAGLSDEEKHQVWREFNEAHTAASRLLKVLPAEKAPDAAKAAVLPPTPGKAKPAKTKAAPKPRRRRPPTPLETVVIKHTKRLARGAASRIPQRQRAPLKSLAFGLMIGFVFILIFLFTFFNERFIAPFIQPSRSFNATEVITANAPVSTKPEIIIPKINVEIPVVYWVTSTDEAAVEDGLDNGVLHYADTAQPGQNGNVVIVGHSASNIFNKGRYKFAFSLLRRLDTGDTFYLQKDGVRYTYQVYKKQVIKPADVSVLAPDPDQPAIATLITCDPPGTNSNRLVVTGKQISPDPNKNSKQATDNKAATSQTTIVPGQSQSLWSRLVHWFTQ